MLKLNVGLSRKVGEPNYGSRGASVNLELEVESALAGDPDRLRDKIRQLFHLAKVSVDEELNGNTHNGETDSDNGQRARNDGRENDNGNGVRLASQKQRNYANQLAGQIPKMGARRMESLSQKMFNKPLADINSLDASALIDMLKAIKEGQVTLEDALSGAPV